MYLISHLLDHQVFDDINGGEFLVRSHVVAWGIHTLVVVVQTPAAFPVRFTRAALLVIHISVHEV